MITPINNFLQLGECCQLVSCHFDVDVFEQQDLAVVESTWEVKLPENLHKAVAKRKAEFIAGRFCAGKAVQHLGQTTPAIDIGDKRQPLWPQGIIGSITHSHGFAAAVAARLADIRGIGIDSEQMINPTTAKNVASHILTRDESFSGKQTLIDDSEQYLTLVFSAKESIFKCLYPQVQRYFDFQDAIILLSNDQPNSFRFELTKSLSEEFKQGFSGEGLYQLTRDFVHTAVILT